MMIRFGLFRLTHLTRIVGRDISSRIVSSEASKLLLSSRTNLGSYHSIRDFSTTHCRNNKPQTDNENRNKDRERHDDEQDEDDEKKRDKKTFPGGLIDAVFLMLGFYIAMDYFNRKATMKRFEQALKEGGYDPSHQPVGELPLDPSTSSLSMTDLCNKMLANGEVESIEVVPAYSDKYLNLVQVNLHPGAVINGKPWPFKYYLMNVPDLETFEMRLREFEESIGIKSENGVPIIYRRKDWDMQRIFFLGLVATAVYLYFRTAGKTAAKGGPQGFLSQFTKANFTLVDPVKRKAGDAITFKDVAGLQEAKVEIMEFVEYLKNPGKFHNLGAKLPKGVLLLGPPGCGKTLLAKAVATEAGVPFYALAGSDFVEMIGGVGAARVRDLFARARKVSPCIVYIDEIDALGRKRSDGISGESSGEGEQTLNQLLVEMDGMAPRKGVILLASTNRPDVLDKALLRPGRFDRHIYLDYPNLQERKEIFVRHASKIKLENEPETYATRIAQLTPRMSGADLANVCNEAALNAARKNRKYVTSEDLEYAIERVVGGTEKRSNAMTASEKRMIAFHECGHALVGWLLEHTDILLKVSIIPRTNNVLGFALTLPSEQKLLSRDEIFDRMCMALGGRAAELIKFNHLSTGSANDLKSVTNMAMAQIKQYGLDPVIGHLSFPPQERYMGLKTRAPYSKRLANTIDQRAQKLATEAFKRTEKLLRDNIDKLNILAEALLEKEVLNYEDVEKLIGPPLGGKKKKAVEFLNLNIGDIQKPNVESPKEESPNDE